VNEEELFKALGVFKALADESRLRIVGILAERARSVEELAELLHLKPPTVSHHLAKLKSVGFVSMTSQGTRHVYRFELGVFRAFRKEVLAPRSLTTHALEPEAQAKQRKITQNFLEGDRLKAIPARRKKRQVVLRWLVDQFETGVMYPEAKLNEMLKRWHADAATLRRELIANKLMRRENGVYWRIDDEA
jgi:hypothetical protein